MTLSTDAILQGLTQPQREAATTIDGPLLVLAGAGSGKTRTITRRIAYMVACGIPSWNILALTFTNKAAGEMRERVQQLLGGADSRQPRGGGSVTVATFHSLCVRILRNYAEPAGLPKTFTIFDSSDQAKLVKQALKDLSLSPDNFQPNAVLSAISKAKNKLQGPDAFAQEAVQFFEKNVARVYAKYEAALKANNGVDFDDLLLKTAILLRDHADVRSQLQDKYQYLLIDEYQDTNHAQFVIAHMLAMNHKNICATGDPDQSIYGWRGANLNNILEFEQFYPNAKTVLLEQNYRSTKVILQAASALIARNTKRKKKDLWTENEAGERIVILENENEHAEAAEIIRRIRTAHDTQKLSWDKFAIFYRVNALTRVLEDALMRAGVPYQIARGTEFYARKEIKDITAYLKTIANPGDSVSLERIINVPPRGLGDTSLTRLTTYAADCGLTLLETCTIADTVEGVTTRASNGCKKLAALFDRWRASVVPPPPARATPIPLSEVPESGGNPLFDQSLEDALANSEEIAPEETINAALAEQRIADGDNNAGENAGAGDGGAASGFVIPGGLRGLVDRIYKESGMEAEFKKKEDDPDHERAANVEELINVAAEFDRNNPTGGVGTLDDFLAQITLASDVDRIKDAGGAVTLMTLHAAKGLEFPWVAVVGMEDGLIPHARAINFGSNPDEMEEERRLAFVGITRAMRQLTLSQARYRMVRGETVRTIESQFLREMPMECFEIVDLTGGGGTHDVPGSGGYRDESGYGRRAQQQRQTESAQNRAYGQALAGRTGGSGGGSGGGGGVVGGGFKRGMLVRHLQFGMGRIEDVSPASGAIRVVIKFTGGGTKTLISPPAKLERVDV